MYLSFIIIIIHLLVCMYVLYRKHSVVRTVQALDPPQEPPHDSPKVQNLSKRRLVKRRAFRGGVLALLATMALW